jgi:hypothetical protein
LQNDMADGPVRTGMRKPRRTEIFGERRVVMARRPCPELCIIATVPLSLPAFLHRWRWQRRWLSAATGDGCIRNPNGFWKRTPLAADNSRASEGGPVAKIAPARMSFRSYASGAMALGRTTNWPTSQSRGREPKAISVEPSGSLPTFYPCSRLPRIRRPASH